MLGQPIGHVYWRGPTCVAAIFKPLREIQSRSCASGARENAQLGRSLPGVVAILVVILVVILIVL